MVVIIGPRNDLALKRQWAIICNNDDPVQGRIYASMVLNTLSVLFYSGDKLRKVFVNDVALQWTLNSAFVWETSEVFPRFDIRHRANCSCSNWVETVCFPMAYAVVFKCAMWRDETRYELVLWSLIHFKLCILKWFGCSIWHHQHFVTFDYIPNDALWYNDT